MSNIISETLPQYNGSQWNFACGTQQFCKQFSGTISSLFVWLKKIVWLITCRFIVLYICLCIWLFFLFSTVFLFSCHEIWYRYPWWPWWAPDFSSCTTMRLAFVVLIEMSRQLLDGLSWNYHCHEQLSWTHSFLWLTALVQCRHPSESCLYYSGSGPSQKR